MTKAKSKTLAVCLLGSVIFVIGFLIGIGWGLPFSWCQRPQNRQRSYRADVVSVKGR